MTSSPPRRALRAAVVLAMLVSGTAAAAPARAELAASGPGQGILAVANVTGQLTDEVTELPVAGTGPVELHRWSAAESGWELAGSSVLGGGGFAFTGVEAGTYTLFFEAFGSADHYPQYLGGGVDAPAPGQQAATFVVGTSDVTRNFEALRFRSVAMGLQFVGGGTAPSQGRILLHRWSESLPGWTTPLEVAVDDPAADVVVGGLWPGRYAVSAEWDEASDYPAQFAGGRFGSPSSTHASVLVLDGSTGSYDAVFRRGGRITAQVLGAEPAERWFVVTRDGHPETHLTGPTGALDVLLLPGTYGLEVQGGAGEVPRSFPGVVVTAGGVTSLGEIDLTSSEEPVAQIGEVELLGEARFGALLEAAAHGVVPSHATLTYQWSRNGEAILGATSSSYRVGLADVFTELDVTVLAHAPGFATGAAMAAMIGTVPAVPTQVALAASSPDQAFGTTEPVTVTATVSGPAGLVLSGRAEILLDGTVVASPAVAGGTARHTLPADLPLGAHVLTARFLPGDTSGRVEGSTSNATTVTVLAPAVPTVPSVRLSRSRAKQAYGARTPVRLTAAVTSPDGAPVRGTVTFRAGRTVLGSVPVAQGQAQLRLPRLLRVGAHRVTAELVPATPSVEGATSAVVTVTVTKAVAKVTGKLAKKRVKVGQRARYTIRVKVAGVARPTGKLVVRDGKKKIRTIKLKARHAGKRTIRLPRLTQGTHRIRVTYQGNASIKKKASKRVALRVR